jgi:hypothetical protein
MDYEQNQRMNQSSVRPIMKPCDPPHDSGSTTLIAASDLVVGHQAHLQQALT